MKLKCSYNQRSQKTLILEHIGLFVLYFFKNKKKHTEKKLIRKSNFVKNGIGGNPEAKEESKAVIKNQEDQEKYRKLPERILPFTNYG